MVIIEGDGESAAAGAIYLATLYASDQQPRRPRRWRLPASTSAVARPNSAAMPRALPAPDARVQSEQEEVCREVAVLREKVMKLEKNGEVRVRALEEEATALQMANAGLEEDNLELALRLRDAEKVALSVNLVREDSRLWIASGTIRVVLGPSVLWICQAQWIWLGFRENDTFRENIRDVIPFPRYPGRADL